MKAMKKVFAMLLALAMIVTAVPVADASAATYNMKAGTTISKSLYAGRSHTLKLSGLKASKVESTKWTVGKTTVVKLTSTGKTKAIIKLVGKGYTIVTAKVTLTNKKTKTYKAKITVKNPSITVDKENMTINLGRYDYINVVSCKPSNARVTYESRDEAVATVVGGKVTGTGIGTTQIVTSVVCGTKKISKVTNVTVEPAADGLTYLGITNSIEGFEDTVWVDDQASIQILAVQGGRPLVGENLVIALDDAKSYVKGDGIILPELNYNTGVRPNAATVTTNEDGIATFVVGYNDSDIKATDTEYVGHYAYKISLASDINTKYEGSLDFAAINLGSVSPSGTIDVSTNDYKWGDWTAKGDGKTTTNAMSTWRRVGWNTDPVIRAGMSVTYVNSQQVSITNGKEHKVSFSGFVPTILVPDGKGTDFDGALTETGTIIEGTEKFGPYYTYTNSDKTVAEIKNPEALIKATLTFNKISLSKYTTMTVYANNTPVISWNGANNSYMENQAVQIPIQGLYTNKVEVKVELKSAGRVDADAHDGYEIKDIVYTYKTKTEGTYASKELPNAKVEWTTESPAYSVSQDLTTDQAAAICTTTNISLIAHTHADGTTHTGKYSRVTYQTPVFPQTGNAILTCYNKWGDVVAYYVCPTKNDAVIAANRDNRNVLDTSAKYCYEVSKDEAFNQVGEIIEDSAITTFGKSVTVNSEKVGVTHLVGTVSLGDGDEVAKLDDTNNKVYTSVQWCPKQNATTAGVGSSNHEFALVGQTVTVKAQVIDTNGNPVGVSGLNIAFLCGETLTEAAAMANQAAVNNFVDQATDNGNGAYQDINDWATRIDAGRVYGAGAAAAGVTAVRVDHKTDTNGQATLVLQGNKACVMTGLTAIETTSRYRVKLIYDASNAESFVTPYLHWVNAELLYTSAVGATGKATSVAAPVRTVNDDADNPKVGSKWYYGFETYAGPLAGFPEKGANQFIQGVKITKLGITITKGLNTVGTITPGNDNGEVLATSTTAGTMGIVARVNKDSSWNNVTFGGRLGVGSGKSNISSRQLTLNVTWGSDRLAAGWFTPNGTIIFTNGNVYTGAAADMNRDIATADVYFQAKDQFGNAKTNGVELRVTGATALPLLTGTFGLQDNTVHYLGNGIYHMVIAYSGNDIAVVTAVVDGVEASSQTYIWNRTAPAFALDQTADTATNKYQSYYDEESGTLILKFTDSVVDGSITPQMITGTCDRKGNNDLDDVVNILADSVNVVDGPDGIRNVVEIKLKDKITNISRGAIFRVNVAGGWTDKDGVRHYLTSDNGVSFKRIVANAVMFTVMFDREKTAGEPNKPVTTPIVGDDSIANTNGVPEIDVTTTVLDAAAAQMMNTYTYNKHIAALPKTVTVGGEVFNVTYAVVATGGGIVAAGALTTESISNANSVVVEWIRDDGVTPMGSQGAGIAIIEASFTDSTGAPVGTKEIVVKANSEGFMQFALDKDIKSTNYAIMVDAGNFVGVVTSSAIALNPTFTLAAMAGTGAGTVFGANTSVTTNAVCKITSVVCTNNVIIPDGTTGDYKAGNDGDATVTVEVKIHGVTVTLTYNVTVKDLKFTKFVVTNVEYKLP